MKNIIKKTFEGNIIARLEPFLLDKLKAIKTHDVNNNVDQRIQSYSIKENDQNFEILVGFQEDSLLGDTTTIKASEEIFGQISEFIDTYR